MTARAKSPPFDGLRVLIVEDEALIAMQIEAELEAAGCTVVGPAPSAPQALRLIQHEAIDVAVLDYRLGHDTSREIAVKLVERNIPFAFVTGHDVSDLPNDLRGQICLAKPVGEGALIATLEAISKATKDG
ncbi:MAG: response regulator [Roseiarcus sp.]